MRHRERDKKWPPLAAYHPIDRARFCAFEFADCVVIVVSAENDDCTLGGLRFFFFRESLGIRFV